MTTQITAPALAQISLKNIRRDGGTQPRAGLDDATVTEYTESMKAGAEFPAVTLFYDGQWYWLADGFHRVKAAEAAGHEAIRADVRQGTKRDAILFSVGVNANHGLRRTNPDKRRAIETLLRDEEWRQWSDREIGRRVQVDHKTVASVRANLTALGEIPRSEARKVERSGQEYHIIIPTSYPPGVNEDVDVESARMIALDLLGERTRDEVKALLNEEPRLANEDSDQGHVFILGSGYLPYADKAAEMVNKGQIGIVYHSPNGVGVYKFDALQLCDWRDGRNALMEDSAAVTELIEMYVKNREMYLDGKVGKNLVRYGLAMFSQTKTYARITASGRAMVERILALNPMTALEVEIISNGVVDRWAFKIRGGERLLRSLHRHQDREKTWIPFDDFGSYGDEGWLGAFTERGLVMRLERATAGNDHKKSIAFYVVTEQACELLCLEALIIPDEPPALPFHRSAGCFVPPDATFKVAVGDTVADERGKTAVVKSLGVWPELKAVYTSGYGANLYENQVAVVEAAPEPQPEPHDGFIPDLPQRQYEFLRALHMGQPVTRNAATRMALRAHGYISTEDEWDKLTITDAGLEWLATAEEAREVDTQIARVWHDLKPVKASLIALDDRGLASDLQEFVEAMQRMLAETDSGKRLGLAAALRAGEADDTL